MFFDSGQHQFKQNFFTDSAEGVLNLKLEIKSPTFEELETTRLTFMGRH